MLLEYFSFVLFLVFNLFVSFLFIYLSFTLINQTLRPNKNAAYECGFQPFSYNISFFEIKYYLQALLFLIFDLEIMFLLPYIMILQNLSIAGLIGGITFFLMLLLGFFYEWKVGALNWE